VIALREGDRCPSDGGELRIGRSIVVGHIYQLGTRYSAPLKATFVEEDGSERLYQMGSHGIGISRILAAAVEQCHDEMGLRLPKALAPFEAVVVLANRDQELVVTAGERVYRELLEAGVDAALDDRDQTAGVKFADADLIGCPVQVVIGKRGVEAGPADHNLPAAGGRSQVPLAEAARAAMDLLATAP
jgi:prolyl-tRNA synthetase